MFWDRPIYQIFIAKSSFVPSENWFSYNCIFIDLIWLLFRCAFIPNWKFHSMLMYIQKEKYILLWWQNWISCIFYCWSGKNQCNWECFIRKVFHFEFIGLTKSDCGKHLLALKINFLWRKQCLMTKLVHFTTRGLPRVTIASLTFCL